MPREIRFPFRVQYLDRNGCIYLWSRHRAQKAAERVFREPFNQCDAAMVQVVDVRMNQLIRQEGRH